MIVSANQQEIAVRNNPRFPRLAQYRSDTCYDGYQFNGMLIQQRLLSPYTGTAAA